MHKRQLKDEFVSWAYDHRYAQEHGVCLTCQREPTHNFQTCDCWCHKDWLGKVTKP
ncbi:hypothetical protein M0R72_13545 [Candidatus Pacearchaeota archaeon]|nr:hypothetical protein [Candidatus Pacearchaeota archaeon]